MTEYQPPFTFTSTILNLVADIAESIGRLSVQFEWEQDLKLRRINQIRTIHSSLAIEGNTLSIKQITAILDGKTVIAPPREITEARNAIAAYNMLDQWEASSGKDLLAAHKVLMSGLVEEAGKYRRGNVGVIAGEAVVHVPVRLAQIINPVIAGEAVVHMAPQADRVQKLIADLLAWLDKKDTHPLIVSCVFHYEFEFIHPFADGNGRMGRLWQTLILSQWQSVFGAMPVESLIHRHQDDYYQAIRQSTESTDSAPFIEFMLLMILAVLEEAKSDGVNEGVIEGLNVKDAQILSLLQRQPNMTQSQLVKKTGQSKSTIERRIRKLKKLGKLERIGADKTGYWKVVNRF